MAILELGEEGFVLLSLPDPFDCEEGLSKCWHPPSLPPLVTIWEFLCEVKISFIFQMKSWSNGWRELCPHYDIKWFISDLVKTQKSDGVLWGYEVKYVWDV